MENEFFEFVLASEIRLDPAQGWKIDGRAITFEFDQSTHTREDGTNEYVAALHMMVDGERQSTLRSDFNKLGEITGSEMRSTIQGLKYSVYTELFVKGVYQHFELLERVKEMTKSKD